MNRTVSKISEADRGKIAQTLNARLADGLDLHSHFKEAHWNLKGPNFVALHGFFEEVADSLSAHTDAIAERVVTLGGRASGTVRHVAKASEIADYPQGVSRDLEHARALAERVDAFVDGLKESRSTLEELGDTDSVDLLTGVITEFEKHGWFLLATTENAGG